MRQIRMVREEQEQSIHVALEKKNCDSDKVRLELEAKLADMSQQLIELVAEKSAFGKALKERAKSVSELTDAKSRAESELQVLQIRVNLLEKENSSLRYELLLSNKEVEIRNDEREYTRKAAESAHKQHLEDTKKVAKLEAECQRLRVLVKKKLPGPAALAQMRLEVEATGKDSVERKKKSLGKVGGPPRSTTLDALEEGSQTGSNDSEILLEKLVAMQEETKMLKEALKNKTDELQEAKLMCANTASKLSKVEQQLDAFSHEKVVPAGTFATSVAHIESTSKQNKTRSLVTISGESCNGAEVHCSDVLASTLIAELENFKTDIGSSDKPLESADLDLMDDFIEMERLASTMFPSKPDTETSDSDSGQAGSHITPTTSDENRDGELPALSQTLATRDRELQAANQLALELACKLKISEEQLSVLHSNNSANDEIILHLREKINTLITNQGENAHTKNIFKEGMVGAQNDVTEMQVPAEPVLNELILLSEGSSRSSQLQLQPPCSSSEDSNSEADANTSIPNCDTKAKLLDAVCKLIHLVKLIAHQTGFQHTHGNEAENGKLSRLPNMQDCNFSGGQVAEMKWNHPTIENSICKLVCYGNDFLQGKVDSLEFIAELSSALDCILGLGLPNSARGMTNVTPEEKLARSVESIIESTQPHTKLLSSVFSEDIEEETKNVLVPVPSAAGKSDSSGFPNLADENNVSHSHKANRDFQVRAAFDRFSSLEEDLAKLKIEKAEMEQKLEVANARVERLRIQVSDAEQLVSNLRVQLASTHELKQLAEDGLEIVACSKAQLESHVKVADAEVTQWQERVAVLHVEVEEERQQYQDALARLKSLRQQLSA
ncbi:hypothetical protein O6H91_03G073300 [Diphasiastrum complanatum]|uniref:Uncharacterized protein n=1 Tax=Diphasiastrum complanatum TaxID=34168 RepID=A0ACC2E817_DIPCM|nr:hypothetical protein O6H91_03G073300 [Diphasiastrum complanatum]